ncbi:MAG: MotA/TolQ/ExbB proton channel family protein [bacterium]
MNTTLNYTLLLLIFLAANASGQDIEQPQEPQKVAPQLQIDTDRLEAAYQKEFAFLETQKELLKQQLASFNKTRQKSEQKQRVYIQGLESQLLELSNQADLIQKDLNAADRESSSVEEKKAALQTTYLRAAPYLEKMGVKMDDFDQMQDQEKLSTIFNGLIKELSTLSTQHTKKGKFYLQDGTEVEGDISYLGAIAAFGDSSNGGGALAPAGHKQLKVWADSSAATAKQFVGGNIPQHAAVYLFENNEHAISEKKIKTITDTINDGGVIGWVIVIIGLLALLLVILRVYFLKRSSASVSKIAKQVGDAISQGHIDQAMQRCAKPNSAICRVIQATLRNLDRDRDHLEDIISESILHESSHLNRFGGFILVIAGVAPLLGLLGTVTGMISTFDIITEFGTGDPKMLSSGISVALVTTEIGLIVAIPALIMGNLLSGWADRIKTDMEHAALHVMNLYQNAKESS